MKRALLASLLICFAASSALLFAPRAAAQTTTVTGTVKDTNGVPYAGAQMKAQLVFSGTPVSSPTVQISNLAQCKANGFGSSPCNVPFTPNQGPFNLDNAGNLPGGGITLQDNSLVTPASTQWLFTVNENGTPPPLGTGPQTCNATLTITGASQSISASFAACPALGSSSSGGGTPNLQHFVIAKTCPDPTTLNVTCFVVADDVSIDNNPTFGLASSTVTTSAGAPVFKSTGNVYPAVCNSPSSTCDIGKVMFGTSNCLVISPQNCFAAIPQGTITAITSAHVATVSTVSTLASVANRANFAWGTDDTAALRTAFDTHIQALFPSELDVSCGNMFFSGTLLKPSRVTRGPYAINIKGCSGNGTQLIPLPIFTQVGDSSGIYLQLNRECGQANTFSCLDSAQDLTFYGLGLNVNPGGATYGGAPISLTYATIGALMQNIVAQGILWNVVNSFAIYAHDCNGCVWNNNLSYAAGNYACHFSYPPSGGQPSSPISGGFCNSSAFTGCTIDGVPVAGTVVFSNFECGFPLGLNGGGNTNDVFGAGLNMTAGGLIDNASIFDGPIYMSGTAKATLHGTNLSKYSNSADGLHITSASNIVHLCNITATGAFTNWLTMTAAATVFDDCSNTLGASTPSISGGGLYLMSPHTVGSDRQVALAAAQTAKTLFTVGSSTALFRAHISVECTTTSASATVTPAILYTDTSNTAQTVTGAAATCTTLGASSVTSQDVTFRARTATAIQYQTTIANTPTYDVNVVVEQLTIN